MAIISIYIPDSGIQRAYDAICSHYGYAPSKVTQSEFMNGVVRNFITEHVKVYELEQARAQAEAAAANIAEISIDNGLTAEIYEYDMVCLADAKDQYNGLASVVAPGNSFGIPLSANGQDPATHYGIEIGITETARQQLIVLELAGGTSTGGIQTLYYTRCDPITKICASTNISDYDIVGKECSFSGLISHMGLQTIEVLPQ